MKGELPLIKPEEVKVLSIEERPADLKKRIGANKFNKEIIEAQFPKGIYLFNCIAFGDNIRRWAKATGYLNPRFQDSEYAKLTKLGRLVAPPLFLWSL